MLTTTLFTTFWIGAHLVTPSLSTLSSHDHNPANRLRDVHHRLANRGSTVTQSVVNGTEGVVNIQLNQDGHSKSQPFPQGNPADIGTLDESLLNAPPKEYTQDINIDTAIAPLSRRMDSMSRRAEDAEYFDDGHTTHNLTARQNVADIFTPIATTSPDAKFVRKPTHPVPAKNIIDGRVPYQTNKFYANLFLGSQTNPVYAMPYELWLNPASSARALNFDYREPEQRVFGPTQAKTGATEFYINPAKIRTLSVTAKEFTSGANNPSSMELRNLGMQSVDVLLYPNKASNTGHLDITLCQGMGFISARYTWLFPAFDSDVLVRKIELVSSATAQPVKYVVTLENNSLWIIYGWKTADSQPLVLSRVNNRRIEATRIYRGLVQISKLSSTTTRPAAVEAALDAASGGYCNGTTLTGQVSGATGKYQYVFSRGGYGLSEILTYALPHHIQSFEASTTAKVKNALKMSSGTKGMMTGVVANQWNMIESAMPVNIGWLPLKQGGATFASAYLTQMSAIAQAEIAQDMNAATNLDTMYFSGKALAKYAFVCLATSEVLQDKALTLTCLNKLKTAFARFTSNTQINPLVFESENWRGIVSSAAYNNPDPYADFGGGYYNDHHFHYGYFIQTAAIVGYLDKKHSTGAWTAANKDWVNTLVRDVANPSRLDNRFPQFRSFDWFHGHSWAKGLFESLDGKDEESSSEDYNFAYAMKLWGVVAGDAAMEARGNLMLAVMKRSMNEYFLLSNGNVNHPASFVPNKVVGILFENKVHHTTYFGSNNEYIQGIHMLPLTAISSYIRPASFVTQEWNAYFAGTGTGSASKINDGWKGILYSNLAIADPETSFKFFAQSGFQGQWLDGGASRTWYMAFAGALGGAATPPTR